MAYKGHGSKALCIPDYGISREINGQPATVTTLLQSGVRSPVANCVDRITRKGTMVPGLSLSLSGTEFKLPSPQTFNDVLI